MNAKFWQRTPLPFKSRSADWDRQLERFKFRLGQLPATDSLWSDWLDLLDQFVTSEVDGLCGAHDDAELRRFQGRVSMLRDLRRELEGLYQDAVKQRQK